MKKLMILFVLLLAACGPLLPVTIPTATSAPTQMADHLPLATAQPTAAQPAQPTPVSGAGVPAAVLAAQKHLAARLNVPAQQIQVTNIISQDWPDSCLGAASATEMCAQVITPGYEVVFTVGATQYIYHTDADGKSLRPLSGQKQPLGDNQPGMLLEWTGADCSRLTVSTVAAFYGKCGETLVAVPSMHAGAGDDPLKNWAQSFTPFEVDTPAGQLKFTGLGKSIASPADQRMIAEWAKLQFEVAQAGRAGAAWGLAFSYHRAGGIAGFCDDVAVYLDGHALVSSCKEQFAPFYLTASEMQQVYAWFDDLKPVDYLHTDSAAADGMTISLILPGQGQKTADDATLSAIAEYASQLAARAVFTQQAVSQVAGALGALTDYFKALNGADFVLAAKLYGGPTDWLQAANPDIKDNLPAWLENACKNNGLVCMLPRSSQYRGPDSRGGYQFYIEFNNPDGSLFVQGPCCGETSGPSISRFVFSVLPTGSPWQVMELPPYVP